MIGAEGFQRADPLRHHAGYDGVVDIREAEAGLGQELPQPDRVFVARAARVRHGAPPAARRLCCRRQRPRTRCWCCPHQPRAACGIPSHHRNKHRLLQSIWALRILPGQEPARPPHRAHRICRQASGRRWRRSPGRQARMRERARLVSLPQSPESPTPAAAGSAPQAVAAAPLPARALRRQRRRGSSMERGPRFRGGSQGLRRSRAPPSPHAHPSQAPIPAGYQRPCGRPRGCRLATCSCVLAGQRPVHEVEDGERGDERELRHAPRLARGAEDCRQVEIARRRDPRASPAASPCSLLARPDDRALRCAIRRAGLGLVVGAIDLVEGNQRVVPRQLRRPHEEGSRRQGMSAAAAASAPARIGAG